MSNNREEHGFSLRTGASAVWHLWGTRKARAVDVVLNEDARPLGTDEVVTNFVAAQEKKCSNQCLLYLLHIVNRFT
jgi:hypothetical protein